MYKSLKNKKIIQVPQSLSEEDKTKVKEHFLNKKVQEDKTIYSLSSHSVKLYSDQNFKYFMAWMKEGDRVEFIHDLWVYRQEKLYQRVQEKLNKENIQGEDVKPESGSDTGSDTDSDTEAETDSETDADADADTDKFVKLTSSKSKNV